MNHIIENNLLTQFKVHGFPIVSMNLWQNRRLYVNIPGLPVIAYDLENSHGKQTYDCKIICHEYLRPATFRNLVAISSFIRQHEDEIKELFTHTKCVSNKYWRNEPVTEKQKAHIEEMTEFSDFPLPEFNGTTKGEAYDYINQWDKKAHEKMDANAHSDNYGDR